MSYKMQCSYCQEVATSYIVYENQYFLVCTVHLDMYKAMYPNSIYYLIPPPNIESANIEPAPIEPSHPPPQKPSKNPHSKKISEIFESTNPNNKLPILENIYSNDSIDNDSGINTNLNLQEIEISQDCPDQLKMKDSKYKNLYLSVFRPRNLNQILMEKLNCKNLDELNETQKKEVQVTQEDQTENLLAYINKKKYSGLSNYHENFTYVELFMFCSLLEIRELRIFITDRFIELISEVTKKSIEIISEKEFQSKSCIVLPEIFFEGTKMYLINAIRHKNFIFGEDEVVNLRETLLNSSLS